MSMTDSANPSPVPSLASILSGNADLDLIILSYMDPVPIKDMETGMSGLSLLGYTGDDGGRVWHARLHRHLELDYHNRPYHHDADYKGFYQIMIAPVCLSHSVASMLNARMLALADEARVEYSKRTMASSTDSTSPDHLATWDQPIADVILAYLDYHPYETHDEWYKEVLALHDVAMDAAAPCLTIGLTDRIGKVPPSVSHLSPSSIDAWLGPLYDADYGHYASDEGSMLDQSHITYRRQSAILEACMDSLWKVRPSVEWLYPTFLKAVWGEYGPTCKDLLARLATMAPEETTRVGGAGEAKSILQLAACAFSMAMLRGPSVLRVIIDSLYMEEGSNVMDWIPELYAASIGILADTEALVHGEHVNVSGAVPPHLSGLTASLVYLAEEYGLYPSAIPTTSEDAAPLVISSGLMNAYTCLVVDATEALDYLTTVRTLWQKGLESNGDGASSVIAIGWLDWCIHTLTNPESETGEIVASASCRSSAFLAIVVTALLVGYDDLANEAIAAHVAMIDALGIPTSLPQHVYGLVAVRAAVTGGMRLLDQIGLGRIYIRLSNLPLVATDLCGWIPRPDGAPLASSHGLDATVSKVHSPLSAITVDQIVAAAGIMVDRLKKCDVNVRLLAQNANFTERSTEAHYQGEQDRVRVYKAFLRN